MGMLYGNKTMQDVETLQNQWISDPIWDIENTEGFEDWREYLTAWRKRFETSEATKEAKRLEVKGAKLGCSIELVGYIEALERRIKWLEDKS